MVKDKILISTIFILLVLILIGGVGYITGSLIYNQVVVWYPCALSVSPSSVSDQTVQATVDTLNLDFDGTANYPVEFDLNSEPKPPADIRFSDDTSLFNVDTITGEISYAPPSSAAGSYIITITAYDNNGNCMSKQVSFNLAVTAAPVTAVPGGGGGRPSCSIETDCEDICGSDRRRECTIYDECEGTSETYYEICVSETGCSTADDCPQEYTCREGICVAPPTAELEEIIEELPIIYPKEPSVFIDSRLFEYPSLGILEAIRQGLLISTEKVDLSMYNLYYLPQETHLGKFMRERPLVRNFFLVLVALSVIVSMFKVIKVARIPKKPAVEFGMLYTPPETN